MIPFQSPAKAHRIFDASLAALQLLAWKPFTGSVPAQAKVCVMPSLGDAAARGFVDRSVFLDLEAMNDSDDNLWLLPEGNPSMAQTLLNYPRCVYAIRPNVASYTALKIGLQDNYQPLLEIRASLGLGLPNPTRTQLYMVPIASTTEDAPPPSQTSGVIHYIPEDSDYHGGELFIAVIVDPDGSPILSFGPNGSSYAAYAQTLSDPSPAAPGSEYGYTALESKPSYDNPPFDNFDFLLSNPTYIAADQAIRSTHSDRYKKVTTRYYVPNEGILSSTSFGQITFSTTWPQLVSVIHPGAESTVYPIGDMAELSQLIVADALAFFS